MSTPPLMSEADLQKLRAHLHDRAGHPLPVAVEDHAIAWLDRMLEVRELQRTRNHGPFHQAMMEAFEAATAQWEHDRELATNGFLAEQTDYDREHPRPTIKEFMMHYRHDPTATCPMCGHTFGVEK